MNKKLLCVVKPRKDENIFSYINRLSIENMYETNTWILNDSDFNHYIGPRNLLPWKFDFSSLMNLTGLSLNELLITTFYNEFYYEKGKFKHFNFTLYQDSLMNAHAKVCPRCLETVGIHHKLWDIRIFLVCPIHNCFLVSSCSSCGKPIKQYRKKFYYCKCNKDLRTLKVKNADESNSFVSRIIYYKFNSDTRNFKESNLNLLTKLDLKYILLIYHFFIRLYYRDKSRVGSISIPFEYEDREFTTLIMNITKRFENWPVNYSDFLELYRNFKKCKPKYDRGSYINNFGYFFIDLYNKYNHPQMDFLRNEFENYIFKNWDSSLISNSRSFNKDIYSAYYLSLSQVANMLKCKHVTVKKLIANGFLKASITKEREEFLLISRESVNRYLSNKRFLVNRKVTSSILNISLNGVISLEKTLLEVKSSPIINGTNEVLYDRRKIDQIFRIIEKRYERYCLQSNQISCNEEELTDITKSIKYSVGTNLSDMITLIVKGKIRVVDKRVKDTGLKRYLIRKNEVWEESLKNKLETGKGVLSRLELVKYLGIKNSQISLLIKYGLLKPTELMEKPYFSVNEAKKYKNNYINLSQLSDLVSQDIDLLLNTLTSKDISPVLNHFQNKFKIYSKSDVKLIIEE